MRFSIETKKMNTIFAYFITNVVLVIFMLVLFQTARGNDDFPKYAGVILLFHIVVSLIALRYCNTNLFNIAGVFLIIAFILHYGQFVLLIFDGYVFYKRNFITRYPFDIYSIALIKCFIITISLTVGLLLGTSKSQQLQMDDSNSNPEYERQKCKRVGLALSILLVPLRLYIDVNRLILSITQGYLSSLHDLDINNMFIVLSRLSTVSIVLFLYGLKKGSKARKIVFFVYATYLLIFMFSGSRLSFIISLVILCMCYFRFEEIKLSWKTIILLIVALLLVTAFMAAAREYRYYNLGNNVSISSFLEVFSRKLTTENSILQELEELGQSFYTCSAAVDHVERYGYAHGKSYFLGIATVLPNFAGVINELDVMSSYTRTMQAMGIHADYVNIGGSFIGEIIYNFAYIFPLFAFFVGLIVAKFSIRFDERIKEDSARYSFVYSVCIMMAILEWSRDTFSASVRYFAWGCILFWLAGKTVIKKSN